jgi:hypothetical protein
MKRRLFTLVALGLILLLAFAAPAQAVVQKLYIQNGADLYSGQSGTSITVYGHVQCTAGQWATFRITVKQDTGYGLSTGGFTCQSGKISGSFTVWDDTGYFTTGPAAVRASISVQDGDKRTLKKRVNVTGETIG